MTFIKCIVYYCTFEGSNEVTGYHGGVSYFYCDEHFAYIQPPSLPEP